MSGGRTHPEYERNAGDERGERVRREDFVQLVVDDGDEEPERRRRREPRRDRRREEFDRRPTRRPPRRSPPIEVEIDGAVVRIPAGVDRSSLWAIFDVLRGRC